jgi:hypothetical protein
MKLGKNIQVRGLRLFDTLTFLDECPVDCPVLLDSKGSLAQAYQWQDMPTAYLIDEKGAINYRHIGFKKRPKKIEKLISDHIAKR